MRIASGHWEGWADAGPDWDYAQHTLFEILPLTSNLKHLHIVRETATLDYRASGELARLLQVRGPWPGLFLDEGRRRELYAELELDVFPRREPPVQLESLAYAPAQSVEFFRLLSRHVAFDHLRSLRLCEVSDVILATAAKYRFPSLNSLALDPSSDLMVGKQVRTDTAAATFLTNLARSGSSLSSIHYTTGLQTSFRTSKALTAILRHHGATLTKLSLTGTGPLHHVAPPLTPKKIEQIGICCPALRELRLPILRVAMGGKRKSPVTARWARS
jgi:hypothetical protein